jgi:hypothetical protein
MIPKKSRYHRGDIVKFVDDRDYIFIDQTLHLSPKKNTLPYYTQHLHKLFIVNECGTETVMLYNNTDPLGVFHERVELYLRSKLAKLLFRRTAG